jgi:type II secretory pathway pseudopilin PulG
MRKLWWITRDTSGLTVAEIIVAMAIIMIGLVSLMAVAPLTTSQVGQSKFKTTAVFLAQQRLEQVKSAAWSCTSAVPPIYVDSLGLSNPATGVPTGTIGTCPSGAIPPFTVTGTTGVVTFPDEGYNTITFVNSAGAVVASYPQHRRVVRITSCDVAPGCGIALDPNLSSLRQVTVTVFFRPMTGVGTVGAAEDSVQLTTLVALRQ